MFGLDHDQIADLALRSAVYGSSERYSIMTGERLFIWEAVFAKKEIKGLKELYMRHFPIYLYALQMMLKSAGRVRSVLLPV